jgi:hypothetical protein
MVQPHKKTRLPVAAGFYDKKRRLAYRLNIADTAIDN